LRCRWTRCGGCARTFPRQPRFTPPRRS